jgi:hypothetical protein
MAKIKHDWKIKVSGQEKAGMGSTVRFHADSLEKAKELADGLVANEHRVRRSVRRVGEPGTSMRVPGDR